MDHLIFYAYVGFMVLAGTYIAYDQYIIAPRESKATLSELDNFTVTQDLRFAGGILAFDFESQRMAIVRRKISRILDISEVRDGTSHWTPMLKNGVLIEKDFYVLLTVADISEPEIRVNFRSKSDLAVCLEIIRQLFEIRNSLLLRDGNKSMKNMVPLSRQGSVVILTAIEVETRSVLSQFNQSNEISVHGTLFHRGIFQGRKANWTVSVAEVGPRNVSAGLVAERAIQFFKPTIALFIGIAGGIKDVKLGDVVIATKIYSYESGKETLSGFIPRPEMKLTSHTLEQRARFVRSRNSWRTRLKEIHHETPVAFVEPIAAGDVLIGTSQSGTARMIKNYYSDAVAAEMEGYGFLSALHLNPSTHGVVVRGISDLFDGKSEADAAGWQSLAADSAAAFAFEMLSEIDAHADVIG